LLKQNGSIEIYLAKVSAKLQNYKSYFAYTLVEFNHCNPNFAEI
jgi:hypothetical protein